MFCFFYKAFWHPETIYHPLYKGRKNGLPWGNLRNETNDTRGEVRKDVIMDKNGKIRSL